MTSSNNSRAHSLTSIPAPAPTAVAVSAALVDSLFDVDATARPTIDVKEGMATIIDVCIAALVETGLVFDRGGILVAIDRDNSVHQMNSATIRFALSKLMRFEKSSLYKGQVVTEPVVVPAWVGETIAALTKWQGMPIVDAISDHPFFTSTGRLVGAGYDTETRVFGRFNDADFSIRQDSTKQDASAALTEVRRLLQTFEFETAGDEAAALAGMLCAVCRPALPTAPLNLIDAPMPGSGKGYLGGLMARLAQNKQHPAKRMGENPDEMHKEIASALLAAKPVIFFDELSISEIDCAAIRMLASVEIYSARLLEMDPAFDPDRATGRDR